jgi:hypothetical protein
MLSRNKGRPSIQNGFPFLVDRVLGQARKAGVFSSWRRAIVTGIGGHSPARFYCKLGCLPGNNVEFENLPYIVDGNNTGRIYRSLPLLFISTTLNRVERLWLITIPSPVVICNISCHFEGRGGDKVFQSTLSRSTHAIT